MLKISIKNKTPEIPYFCAENASLIGSVTFGEKCSVWYSAVLRGDINDIIIGDNCNIQDNATLHVNKDNPCVLKNNITVGHNVVLHGCTIGSDCMIGMGAIILNGAIIEDNVLIAAGAVIPENMHIPSNSLVVGIPAKVKRKLNDEDIKIIKNAAQDYVDLLNSYPKNTEEEK